MPPATAAQVVLFETDVSRLAHGRMCTLVQRAGRYFFHAGEVDPNSLTRSRVIQVWFAGVTFIIAACIAFDLASSMAAIGSMLAVSLVPPIILLVLWPGIQLPTAHEVLHSARRSMRD
jgi:hypothetical protein